MISDDLIHSVKLKQASMNNKSNNGNPDYSISSTSVAREKELYRRLRNADIESWYESIADYTYPTIFLPITIQQAKAFIQQYNTKYKYRTTESAEEGKHTEATLNELNTQICTAIKSLYSGSDEKEPISLFVKLSSRSPKDSKLRQQVALDILGQELKDLTEATENNIVASIMKANIQCLKLKSADEIMETLASSDRICEDDLPLALNYPSQWSQHIVIRKWIDIPIQFEFRGFVYNNQLTALCQYYNEAVFDQIIQNKQLIQDIILQLFEKIKNKLPFEPKE
jgi:hypothetical protein